MKSSLNPTDFGRYLYNHKSSDQAITTIPRRDKIIPGSKIFDVAAQSMALYQKDVHNDMRNAFYKALDEKRDELSLILQASTRIDKAIEMANDMRRSDQERRDSAEAFVQTLIDNHWTIRFHMDHELEEMITQMVEVGSGEVKMTFPQDKTLEFKKFLQNYPGILLDTMV